MVETLTAAAIGRHRITVVLVAVLLAAAAALVLGLPGSAHPVRPPTSPTTTAAMRPITESLAALHRGSAVPAVVTTPSTTTTTAVVPPVAAPPPVAATPTAEPSVATLVADVEAAGIEPGPNWSWSMGDTSTECGVIPGDNVATGCTFGPVGAERTVFAGSPTLALVAHELANAETMDGAPPSLLSEVDGAAGGASWSPTDAVSSCLVQYFMGFQDGAAGPWQCPASLATTVAENIHDAP
jgi:hypothetical protein